jgi:hypothetical protein
MERLAILLALFVILVVLILARRQARRDPADAPAPVAMPAAALADVAGTRRPQGAAGARDPYARLGTCPSCGRPMVERVGKRGSLKGKPYLVCSGDPPCGTVPAEG